MKDTNSINSYLKLHEDHFLRNDMDALQERLMSCSDSKWDSVRLLNLKEPLSILLVSLCAGIWGIDRFILGKKGTGILKLFVCQLGIIAGVVSFFLLLAQEAVAWGVFCLVWFIVAELWWLVDVCLSIKFTKEYNYNSVIFILDL